MIKNLTIILVLFISLNTKIFSQDLAVYYLFDISKSYKEKALDEAIEVSEYIYDVFTDTKFLGSVSPQYHLAGTIDAKSIKSTKPCTTIYKNSNTNIFSSNDDVKKVDMSSCFDKIKKLPYSLNTDIRGGVFNASNSMSDDISYRALIIFSDMENDPVKSFQNKLPLDNLEGITVYMLYSHTMADRKGNITSKHVKEFTKIFKDAGAKDVKAKALQSIAVRQKDGAIEVVKYFRNSFKRK